MEIFEDDRAGVRRNDAPTQERRHCREMFGGEGFADGPGAGRGREKLMRGVPIFERARKELATQKLQMVVHWKGQRFMVQVLR